MKTKITGDPQVLRDAAKKASLEYEPPPYGPPTPTGLTNQQQAALWFSRQRRRRAPGPAPHEEG